MSMLNAGELECTTKNEGLPKSLQTGAVKSIPIELFCRGYKTTNVLSVVKI